MAAWNVRRVVAINTFHSVSWYFATESNGTSIMALRYTIHNMGTIVKSLANHNPAYFNPPLHLAIRHIKWAKAMLCLFRALVLSLFILCHLK